MDFCRVYHEIKAPTNRQFGAPEITGKIVFTPDLQKGEVWTVDGVVVPAMPIECEVIDGKMYDTRGEHPSRYVNLMAGGATSNPSAMHWRVSYHDMRVGKEHFYIEPFIFKAIPYTTVNLSDVTPVAGYTPPGIIRGGTGDAGLGIIFKGVVLTREDLPVDGLEPNHAYAITTTKELAVWQGDSWTFIPNFAGIDVTLEDISDWHYEARKNVEFSREQLETMRELKEMAEKYAEAGYDYMKMSMTSADGKSSIFYGSEPPETAKEGDTWFKDTEDGSVIIMQYVDGNWVAQVDVDAMDKELAENAERVKEAQDAIDTLTTETLPALRAELDNLDTVTALEVADKLATLETKLAEADVALKQELQGELTALDEALSGDLTTKLAGLKDELEALDTDVAREAADNLATLETKLANADVALKQELQGELTALDEALSGDLTTKLAGLRGDLEAADTARAEAVATAFVQLEDRLKAADTAIKDDLVAQLGDLETDLAALDTAVGKNLTTKLAALRTELLNADTAVNDELVGKLATLKTQLQNADTTLTSTLRGELSTLKTQLQNADEAITTDLATRLEDARKVLADASDTIATDLAEVDSLVSRQRPGNLFPDPFFEHPVWGSRYNAAGKCLQITANGTTNGVYYFPDGSSDYSHLMTLEPGASYLFTVDARFGGTADIQRVGIHCRYIGTSGAVKPLAIAHIERTNEVSYKWGTTSAVLKIPADVASEVAMGFFVYDDSTSGNVRLRNVRLHRAADNSLIIDGAVTAAKVKAGVIEADHIAAGAIETEKLAADSVVAGKIAANAVVAENIKAEQITTAKLAVDAVTAIKIAADQILAKHIKSEQITTAKLDADAVTATKVAADAILARNIKAGQVTTEKLEADAVTADKVAADAILARNIKAEQVTTAKLDADAVTATKVAADAILARNIKTDQILAKHIKSEQITTAKIAAGAVTADELQAENATIDKLWTNGIAAKSIVAQRIFVAPDNMIPNGNGQAGDNTSWPGFIYVKGAPEITGSTGGFRVTTSTQNVWLPVANDSFSRISVDPGRKYHVEMFVVADRDGSDIAVSFDSINASGDRFARSYSLWPKAIPKTVVNKYTGIYNPPLGAVEMRLQFVMNHSSGTPAVQTIYGMRMVPMNGGTLIEDGAITTGKVASNAITANEIAADQILAKHVKTDQILAKHVKAGEIKATHLLAEEATIDKLWANGIAAKSITASKLTISPGNLIPEADSFGNPDAELVAWKNFGRNAAMGAVFLRGSIAYIVPVGIKTQAGDRFRLTMDVRADTLNSTLYFRMWDTDGVRGIPITDLDSNRASSASAGDAFREAPPTVNAWHKYEASFTVPEDVTLDFRVYGNWTSSGSPVTLLRNLRMQRMTGSTLIEDGAITTGKVASNAITANEIAADQILAKHVKTDQILAKHVKSGEIKAEHLLAEEATINKLWTNGLVAKTIATSRLAVSTGNMFPDPNFEDPSWSVPVEGVTKFPNGISLQGNGKQHGIYLQPEGKANAAMQHEPGVNYLMTAHLRFGGNANITKFSVYARMVRDTGVTGATKVGEFVRFPSDQDHASYRYMDNYTVLDFSSIKMAPGGYFTLGFFLESSEPSGGVDIRDVRLTKMSGTTLIEDGAITTGKVAANAITANEIATDAVTAKQIKAGQITSDHISTAKISSDKITVANGFIKTAMIGDSQITNAKIGTLDAAKITTGYLNASRIKSGDIKTVHIGANQITANEIASKAVKVDQIDANAVRSNHIYTDQILAKHVKTDQILAKHVKAGEIKATHVATDQILAKHIKAGEIKASHVATDQILAKHVKAGEIKASHIAADTITAKEIKAETFTQVGKSVIPLYPGTTRPAWTINANQTSSNPTSITDGDPTWYRFGETQGPGSENMVEVDPDIEYIFSVWIHGTTGAVTYVEAKNQDDSLAVKTGGITGYGSNDKSGTAYLIRNLSLVSGWRKISTKITFTPETRFVKISRIYGNHSNGVTGSVYLADMRLYPDIASQAKVDAVQDAMLKELDRRTVGMVPVKSDKLARSTTHKVGVMMPMANRALNLYLSPSFEGTIAVQVFYTYSLLDNKTGHSYQYFWDHTQFDLKNSSSLNSYFGVLAEGGKLLHKNITVPEGNVDQAMILVDHMDWQRG